MNHRDHRNTEVYIVGYLVEEYHLLCFPLWPLCFLWLTAWFELA